jgi:hypothetical protein
MNNIIDVDRGEIINNFIIDLDAFIRIGGNQGDGQDDSEKINALLLLAKKRYGIHFEGDEPSMLCDKKGGYFASSMPVNIQGTFNTGEKAQVNHFICRYSDEIHFCLVPGCSDPQIKTHENKYSNGQTHIKRNHSELIPFSLWNQEMLNKREAVWKELNKVFERRKSTGSSDSNPITKRQRMLDFTPPTNSPTPQKKSSISDIPLVLVKFICLGLFPMAITKNPGFVYLIQGLLQTFFSR